RYAAGTAESDAMAASGTGPWPYIRASDTIARIPYSPRVDTFMMACASRNRRGARNHQYPTPDAVRGQVKRRRGSPLKPYTYAPSGTWRCVAGLWTLS